MPRRRLNWFGFEFLWTINGPCRWRSPCLSLCHRTTAGWWRQGNGLHGTFIGSRYVFLSAVRSKSSRPCAGRIYHLSRFTPWTDYAAIVGFGPLLKGGTVLHDLFALALANQ
jgi:hypothetical protein